MCSTRLTKRALWRKPRMRNSQKVRAVHSKASRSASRISTRRRACVRRRVQKSLAISFPNMNRPSRASCGAMVRLCSANSTMMNSRWVHPMSLLLLVLQYRPSFPRIGQKTKRAPRSRAIKKVCLFRVDLLVDLLPQWLHNSVSVQRLPTQVVQSVSLRPSQARSESSRLMAVARAGVLLRSRLHLIKRDRLRKPFAIPRSCCARWRDMIRKIQHRLIGLCRITKPQSANR